VIVFNANTDGEKERGGVRSNQKGGGEGGCGG